MFDKLFEPIQIQDLKLRNRIVMPAMGTRMADENGYVTPRLIAYHEARARGGCGLNIVEVSAVHTPSAPAHFVSISDDRYMEGHRKLTGAIHRAGGKAGIQLWQGSIAVSMDPKAQMLVVNEMKLGPYTLPAITKDQIEEIVRCYGEAAARCVEAGYDCIEFHCAHNYLPHSFLSGGLNHRTDEYGGSFENRARFPLDCIRAILAQMPEGMPLFMRIDAMDDNLPGGMDIEEVIAFCKMAGDAGVNVLDVSRGNIITEASVYEVPPIDLPNGFNVENASRIRRETGLLTIAVGRINTAQLAEDILEQDKADMVVMGRAQLADPEFCNKARAGRVEDIIHCVGCDQGCYDGFCDVANRPFITCLRNPGLGYELDQPIVKTAAPKKVLIGGGGMAGLEAATILLQRGHRPEIYEAGDRLGGQFLTAGQAPGKTEMKEAAVSFAEQVVRSGVPVHFKTAVTPAILQEARPDAVILAVGSSPIALQLDGMDQKPVYQAHDVLEGRVTPEGKICIIGGGLVGLETADTLASAGHAVTVLEMKEAAGADLGRLRNILVMRKMRELNVEIRTRSTCTALCADGVTIRCGDSEETISCDSVVLAVGSKPNDTSGLTAACEDLGIPCYIIGDAKQARRALDAIAEGYEAARCL